VLEIGVLRRNDACRRAGLAGQSFAMKGLAEPRCAISCGLALDGENTDVLPAHKATVAKASASSTFVRLRMDGLKPSPRRDLFVPPPRGENMAGPADAARNMIAAVSRPLPWRQNSA